jgi:DNA-binding NarL/FixJ family response regulator
MNPLPHVILLNIDLTQGDAFRIQKRIRTDPAARGIPVVALASADDFAVRKRVQRAGFAGLIVKPLPRRMFGELVNRVLSGEQVWEAIS